MTVNNDTSSFQKFRVTRTSKQYMVFIIDNFLKLKLKVVTTVRYIDTVKVIVGACFPFGIPD